MGCLGPCPAVNVVVSLFTALSTKVLFAIYGKGSTEATLAVCIYGVARRAARGATIPLPACGGVSGADSCGGMGGPSTLSVGDEFRVSWPRELSQLPPYSVFPVHAVPVAVPTSSPV